MKNLKFMKFSHFSYFWPSFPHFSGFLGFFSILQLVLEGSHGHRVSNISNPYRMPFSLLKEVLGRTGSRGGVIQVRVGFMAQDPHLSERSTQKTPFRVLEICNTPGLLQESLRPFGPECPGSVPGVSLGVCLGHFGPRAPQCPKSVPRVSQSVRDTFLTIWGHSRDTFGHSGARGPKGPRDTLRDTPGTLRARRAPETPVAGRGGCN